MRLAVLSDLHLPPPRLPEGRERNLKRRLGELNWLRKRHRVHRAETIERILTDLAAEAPDHIAVLGDLVNLGLPVEHEAAARWIARLGSPEQVTVIPGNHDIYTRLGVDPGVARWSAWMSADGRVPGPWQRESAFPFVRRRGPAAIIALNSAHETPPLVAWGKLGRAQLERLAILLRASREEGLVRVVLIHHPPLPGLAGRFRGLRDARDLATVLSDAGAELVLHGHNHRDMMAWLAGAAAPVPVVGIASASASVANGAEPLARYALINTARRPIELIVRGLCERTGAVVELTRRQLTKVPSS